MAETVIPVPSENDWNLATSPEQDWAMNQNEPLGATEKRVRWKLPADTMVQIGFPERVPGTGPSYTAPFRVGDVFSPVPGAPNSEPILKFPIEQRDLEWWMFTPAPIAPPTP